MATVVRYAMKMIFITFCAGQDSLLDQFSIIPEKFIETSLSPHVGVGSRLECAMLCQRDKCCYSALTKNDDYNVQCQMLNYVFPEEDLSDDEGGAYLIRIHEPGILLTNKSHVYRMLHCRFSTMAGSLRCSYIW